ncbi:hypothetical protein ACQ4M4_01830 [Leptolyngbya sp. AN02str]|uniref:hypothetical protein n=1 Tax=Leptolyngbya sp. AN02str TaxID=3423363 RepID=UPI003D3227DA
MFKLNRSITQELESCIRSALDAGELTPSAQQRIQDLVDCSELTQRDHALLDLLNDAIADGCVAAQLVRR